MKFLCFLVFIGVIHSAVSHLQNQTNLASPTPRAPLVSVRDIHSGLPICTGIFVSENTILTTSRCLFCDEGCAFKIFSINPDTGAEQEYTVESITLHGEYEEQPQKNAFGLIKIAGEIPSSLVAEIHKPDIDPFSLQMSIFKGRFNDRLFIFDQEKANLMDNSKCTFTLGKYVPESNFCVFSKNKFFFSESDQGSPLMYLYNGKMYLLGIYVSENPYLERGSRIVIYQGIIPHIKWINKVAKNETDLSCPTKFLPVFSAIPPPRGVLTRPVFPPQSVPSTGNIPPNGNIPTVAGIQHPGGISTIAGISNPGNIYPPGTIFPPPGILFPPRSGVPPYPVIPPQISHKYYNH